MSDASKKPPRNVERTRVAISLACGSMSGMAGALVGHPLDTIRVRMIASRGSTAKTSSNRARVRISALKAFQDATAASSGGIAGLWRGIIPPLFTIGITTMVGFSANEACKRAWPAVRTRLGLPGPSEMRRGAHPGEISRLPLQGPLSLFEAARTALSADDVGRLLFAGFSAGACCSIVSCPATCVKISMQTEGMKSIRQAGASSSAIKSAAPAVSSSGLTLRDTAAAASRIWATRGIRGFYRAYGLHVAAEVLGRGYYYACYGALKMIFARYLSSVGGLLPPKQPASGRGRDSVSGREPPKRGVGLESELARLPLWSRVVAGSLTGLSSWTLVYPIEVVKTRIQSGMYSSMMHCITSSWRKEGPVVFYRGLGVAMMRAAPTAAVTLTLFDLLQEQGLRLAGIDTD